jgi:hypothetical protein
MSVPFVRFCRELPRAGVLRFRSLSRDTVGAVAAVVAIMAPVLVGSMGLGGEAGWWYLKQRELQNAADVAAHATAIRLAAGDDSQALAGVADYVAEQSDIDLANADLQLNQPPLSGAFIEDGSAVEVIVTETVPRLFSAMYSNEPVEISARAVATAQGGGTGCILALNASEEGAVTVAGSATVFLTMCDIVSNSAAEAAFRMESALSTVSANCIQTSGSADMPANLSVICGSVRQSAAPATDPLATIAEPASVGACADGAVGLDLQTTSVTPAESHPSGMSSMRFCNGLDLRGTVNLAPGLYIVEGGTFRINALANVSGSDVVFYLADGVNVTVDGSAVLNVSAPTSGVYNGIVFFGSRSATSVSHAFGGNAGSRIDGAVYLPASDLTWTGSAETSFTGCTQVIADTVTFDGGFFSFHCLFPSGPTIRMAGDVRIVE